MRLRSSGALARLLIVLSGAAFGGAVVTTATALTTHPTPYAVHQPAPLEIAPATDQYNAIAARPAEPTPVRLVIPRLGISSAVESLAINNDYSLQAPPGVADVGWYRLGASPGFAGDAIISGHRGYPGGTPAAFNGLSRLNPGDEIYIQFAGGRMVRFSVMRVYSTPFASVPAGFFATDGVPRLSLVTCSGDFRTKDLTYSDRLVVEAQPEINAHQGEI
jgi:sortase (surface protein transpeptidase)